MFEDLLEIETGIRFAPARVEAVKPLTPHMIRITLKSELIRGFSDTVAGAHFKLVVPTKDQSAEDFINYVAQQNYKSEMRTYTIRNVRPAIGELDVDIVVHGDLGRVGPWAQRTRPGDGIVISICGAPKLITESATRIVAAADLTGFPALAAGLETLDAGIDVSVYVEIPSDGDRQPLNVPDGVDVNWIVKTDPKAPADEMLQAIRGLPEPDQTTSIFVAGEFSMVADLRRYFLRELKTEKSMAYISSYWRAGLIEPDHSLQSQ